MGINRSERISDIVRKLDLCVETFCYKTNGLFFDLDAKWMREAFEAIATVLEDGEEIDFYSYDEIEAYEEKLLKIFYENGVRVDK